jgi:hypothetical protein
MVLAEKDKPRVRGQTKGFFSKAMKVEVHLKLPLESSGKPLELWGFLVRRRIGRGEEI